MALIQFLAGQNFVLNDLSGSGLGFYGSSGFGFSVPVGSYQGRTFITDSTGALQGQEVANVQYLNSGSGILGQAGSGLGLRAIPNYQATLNIRFTNASAVQAQNVKVYIYDRVNINNPASGVLTKVAQIIHPDTVQNNNGSGDTSWQTPAGSAVVVSLANSPGTSGFYAGDGVTNISSRPDVTHDWYICISASPNTIGAKTAYGLYVSLEYL